MREYIYTHTETVATTGYFSCQPKDEKTLREYLADLASSPFDTFLHRAVLSRLCTEGREDLPALAREALVPGEEQLTSPVLAALLCECAHLTGNRELAAYFPEKYREQIAAATPLPFLRALLTGNRERIVAWNACFARDLLRHIPQENVDLPPVYSEEELRTVHAEILSHTGDAQRARIEALSGDLRTERIPEKDHPYDNLYREAADRLLEAGILVGQEMRHEASLAPIALLHDWAIDLRETEGRNDFSLSGRATAYGRGFSLEQARLSYIMEIVERASSYVSVAEENGHACVTQRRTPLPIEKASCRELCSAHVPMLDPGRLPLEADAPDDRLAWVRACDPSGRTVLVPAQCVFLFLNLDEPDLLIAQGSTGLAAGTTTAQAKVHALLECLERDALATMPFTRESCFRLKSRDPMIQWLLDDYEARRMAVQFRELTTEFGIPAYQCFVRSPEGTVVQAAACHLQGSRACLSALSETPWPYSLSSPAPTGKPTGPGMPGIGERYLEDLPDFSTGSSGTDLALLEAVLAGQHREPLYVDITRDDLDFPVVRAILPDTEQSAEFDEWTRPGRRLFARFQARNGRLSA